jgi:hypothetical protein
MRNNTKTTQQPAGNAPSHIAYQVRDREGGKGFWTRIGSAWKHGDGEGFTIHLDAMPFDGRITLRIFSDKPE